MLAGAEELQQEHRTLVEVRRQAGLRQARADALLLKGDADGAAAHVEAAAGFLLPFAPLEAASVRHAGAGRLYDEAASAGRDRACCARSSSTGGTRRSGRATAHPVDWAATQNNLGLALADQAGRTEGTAGAALLAEAVAAYRAALEVRTPRGASGGLGDDAEQPRQSRSRTRPRGPTGRRARRCSPRRWRPIARRCEVRTEAAHPVDWAMTQNNLGIALVGAGRADRRGGGDGAARRGGGGLSRGAGGPDAGGASGGLGDDAEQPRHRARGPGAADRRARRGRRCSAEAEAAYRAALEVYTRAAHPVDWAMTQNNLGVALADQAGRTDGAAGGGLLGEAVAAYRAALEVRTAAEHPVDWATTQNNLGNALAGAGARVGGGGRGGAAGEAVAAYRAALEVYTRRRIRRTGR